MKNKKDEFNEMRFYYFYCSKFKHTVHYFIPKT